MWLRTAGGMRLGQNELYYFIDYVPILFDKFYRSHIKRLLCKTNVIFVVNYRRRRIVKTHLSKLRIQPIRAQNFLQIKTTFERFSNTITNQFAKRLGNIV